LKALCICNRHGFQSCFLSTSPKRSPSRAYCLSRQNDWKSVQNAAKTRENPL